MDTFRNRISDAFMPVPLAQKLDIPLVHDTAFNGWTVMHFLSGAALGSYMNYQQAFWSHTLWELFQFWIGDNQLSREDLIADIPLDTIAFLFGVYLRKRLK